MGNVLAAFLADNAPLNIRILQSLYTRGRGYVDGMINTGCVMRELLVDPPPPSSPSQSWCQLNLPHVSPYEIDRRICEEANTAIYANRFHDKGLRFLLLVHEIE